MRQTLNDTYRNAAEDFANKITEALDEQVDSIILYGSVARGEAGRDSDVDILVIGADPSITRDRLSEICADLMYDRGYTVLLSLAQFSQNDFQRLREIGSPFIRNVLTEGIILYDNGTYSRARSQAATI